jgi:hypothetical protein
MSIPTQLDYVRGDAQSYLNLPAFGYVDNEDIDWWSSLVRETRSSDGTVPNIRARPEKLGVLRDAAHRRQVERIDRGRFAR